MLQKKLQLLLHFEILLEQKKHSREEEKKFFLKLGEMKKPEVVDFFFSLLSEIFIAAFFRVTSFVLSDACFFEEEQSDKLCFNFVT